MNTNQMAPIEDARTTIAALEAVQVEPWDAMTNEVKVDDWRINTWSTDSPILVYQNCSVIQDEQAEYVLRLINADCARKLLQAVQVEPVGHLHSNGDFCCEKRVISKEWPVSLYTAPQINVERERDTLRTFAKWVMEARSCVDVDMDGTEIDGGDLQDKAVELGLLKLTEPAPREPCGENCACNEYYSESEFRDGKVMCYRKTELLLGTDKDGSHD